MRFLVPTFFIYGIAAVWLLKLLAESWRGPAIVASLVALLLTALAEVPQTRMQVLVHRGEVDSEQAAVAHDRFSRDDQLLDVPRRRAREQQVARVEIR